MSVATARRKTAVPKAPPAPKAAPGAVQIGAGPLTNLLADASLFASTDQMRPVLCAVKLVLDGSTLTAYATDSYVLCERSVQVEGTGSWTRYVGTPDRRLLKAILSGHGTQTATIGTTSTGHHLRVSVGVTTTTVGEVIDKYPDFAPLWAGAVPGTDTTIHFNPLLLARLQRLSGSDRKARSAHPLTLTINGSLAPATWALTGDEGPARGLIMPIRLP